MNPKLILSAISFLQSPAGGRLASKIASGGNNNLSRSILERIAGKNVTVTNDDVLGFSELAAEFKGPTNADVQTDIRSDAFDKAQLAKDLYRGPVGSLSIDTPGKMALKAAVAGVSNGVRAAGNIAENNGNRLAAALLARHEGSDRQDALYGQSARDKASGALAQERIRKGTNIRHGTDAIANTIDTALGAYNAQDLMAKQLAYTGTGGRVPSALYDLMGRQTSHLD